MKRPALLAAVIGLVTVVLRRRSQSRRADNDLWTEATAAPDLR